MVMVSWTGLMLSTLKNKKNWNLEKTLRQAKGFFVDKNIYG